jgi:hypothetical protein
MWYIKNESFITIRLTPSRGLQQPGSLWSVCLPNIDVLKLLLALNIDVSVENDVHKGLTFAELTRRAFDV